MTGAVDHVLSAALRRRFRPVPRGCFRNAVVALGDLYAIDPRGRYVEGWALMSCAPLLTEHAWLALRDGRIVEPTADLYSAYFPVVAIGIKRALAMSCTGCLPRFGSPSRAFVRRSVSVYVRAMEAIGMPLPRREATGAR